MLVKNTGRTAAENCNGGINLFGTDSTGQSMNVKGGLCWSRIGNPHSITINVEDEQALDIYRVFNPQPNINTVKIPTEAGWKWLRMTKPLSVFANPANLKMKVRITAKNAKHCGETYSLRSSQNDLIMS